LRQAYDYWQDQPGNRRDLVWIRNPRHRVAALAAEGTTGRARFKLRKRSSLLLSHRGQRGRASHPRPTDEVRQEPLRSTLMSGPPLPLRGGGPLGEEQGTREQAPRPRQRTQSPAWWRQGCRDRGQGETRKLGRGRLEHRRTLQTPLRRTSGPWHERSHRPYEHLGGSSRRFLPSVIRVGHSRQAQPPAPQTPRASIGFSSRASRPTPEPAYSACLEF